MNAFCELCLQIGYHDWEHFDLKSFDYFRSKKTSKILEIFKIDDYDYCILQLIQ